jgi:hypothetical protein
MDVRHRYNITTFDKLKVNYWGIAKCGNSTLKYILYRANNPKSFDHLKKKRGTSKNSHGNVKVDWISGNCHFISPSEASKNNCVNFTVLRDPIQRAYSMYADATRSPTRICKSGSSRFKKEAKRIFEQRKSVPSMIDFLNLIAKYSDKERNLHHRTQKSYCLLDDIIKLDIATLPLTIHQIHPSLEVNVRLNASRSHPTPSEEILRLIHDIYAEDFELLKQCIKPREI